MPTTVLSTMPSTVTTELPCSVDADLWFAERPRLLAVAQARCAGCPVSEACLAGALERAEPWGVWGGRIVVDGRVVPAKRGRGRPPRADRVPA